MELLDEIHMEGILAFAALIGKRRAREIKCKVACQAELWSRRKGKVDRKWMAKVNYGEKQGRVQMSYLYLLRKNS